jgi:GxxExxY protein
LRSSVRNQFLYLTKASNWIADIAQILIVENQVLVEIKSIDQLASIHDAQLLSYLKLGAWKIGLLINFNVQLLKRGIHRKVVGQADEISL